MKEEDGEKQPIVLRFPKAGSEYRFIMIHRHGTCQRKFRKEGIARTNQGLEITLLARPESEVAGRPGSHTHTLSRGYPSDSRLGLPENDNITSSSPVKTDSIVFEAKRKASQCRDSRYTGMRGAMPPSHDFFIAGVKVCGTSASTGRGEKTLAP